MTAYKALPRETLLRLRQRSFVKAQLEKHRRTLQETEYMLAFNVLPIKRKSDNANELGKRDEKTVALIDLLLLKDAYAEDLLYMQMYNSDFPFNKALFLQLFEKKEYYKEILGPLRTFHEIVSMPTGSSTCKRRISILNSWEAEAALKHDPDLDEALRVVLQREDKSTILLFFSHIRKAIRRDPKNKNILITFSKGHLQNVKDTQTRPL